MSSKNFKVINPQSIYNDIEFNQEPYSQTDKFSVYVPREKDHVGQLLRKDKEKLEGRQAPQYTREQLKAEQQPLVEITKPPSRLRERLQEDLQLDAQISQQHQYHPQQKAKAQVGFAPKPIFRKSSNSQAQMDLKGYRSVADFKETMKKEQELKQFRESLYYDERTKSVPKSNIQNHIIEEIVQDGDILMKKTELMDSIYKLKKLNLLKNHDINVNRYKGASKIGFVYNDYHSKSTNNGFSRNFGGVFYTR